MSSCVNLLKRSFNVHLLDDTLAAPKFIGPKPTIIYNIDVQYQIGLSHRLPSFHIQNIFKKRINVKP